MRYKVRVSGAVTGTFATQEEAVAAVRDIVRQDVNAEPILDDETGKPVTPASSRAWREHLAHQIGY